MVEFYGNQGMLYQVSLTSGVPMQRLQVFLDTGYISTKDRMKLEKHMNKGE
jgi:hypothetical protein